MASRLSPGLRRAAPDRRATPDRQNDAEQPGGKQAGQAWVSGKAKPIRAGRRGLQSPPGRQRRGASTALPNASASARVACSSIIAKLGACRTPYRREADAPSLHEAEIAMTQAVANAPPRRPRRRARRHPLRRLGPAFGGGRAASPPSAFKPAFQRRRRGSSAVRLLMNVVDDAPAPTTTDHRLTPSANFEPDSSRSASGYRRIAAEYGSSTPSGHVNGLRA